MMWKLLFSLRYRIIVTIVVIEAIMLSIMVWANTSEVRKTHADRLAQSAQVIQQQFSSTAGRYLVEADRASLEEQARAVLQHDELDYIIVFDSRGQALVEVGDTTDLQGPHAMPQAVSEGVLEVTGNIVVAGKPRALVHMGFSLANVDRTVRDALNRGIAIAATAILLSILAAVVLGHVLTRNLRALSRAAERFGRREADTVVPLRGRDEFTQVAEAFNKMVADRTSAEAALRDSEEQARLLLDCAGQGVFAMDVEGRCTYANPECLRLLGYDAPGLLLGTHMTERIHHSRPDGTPYPEAECPMSLPLREGEAAQSESEVLWRADGSCFPAEYRSRPVKRDGKVAGAVVTFSDIARRKREEAVLRDREVLLKSVVDNTSAAIFLKDAEGRFILVNKYFTAWHGVEAAQAIGKTAYDLFSKEQADIFTAQHQEVLKTGQAVVSEAEISHGDGITRHCLVTRFPVAAPGGGPLGVGTVVTDLTELKAAQRQLLQAQKLETIGQLTGGVAHDFNNLLAIIMGNLQLVGEDLKAQPDLRERVEGALEAARRGADLTHHLLAFARRQTLAPRVAEPNALVSGMGLILERTLGETIEIETILATDLSKSVVDPVQLENALLNLAVNARDSMPDGGKLTIETANARLAPEAPEFGGEAAAGDYVMIAVSDSGRGMAPEVATRAFEPFFTTKDAGRGIGLGLSMVYGFVKQSGGQVKLYSEVGWGTTVKIFLPRAAETEVLREERAESEDEPYGAGERILVVEDEAEVRALVVRLLEDYGYDVTDAENGPAALEILRGDCDFDLLFTDIVLPGGMDGMELAMRARKLCPVLAVLYTTGYTGNVLAQGGALEHDAAFISKPFDKRKLARAIHETLDRDGGGAIAPRPMPATVSKDDTEDGVGVILVVDDDAELRDTMASVLRYRGFDVHEAGDGPEALAVLESTPSISVLLTDIYLSSGMDGLELGKRALDRRPDLEVLYISGNVESADLPPRHCIARPFTMDELESRIRMVAANRIAV
jgi:PAS domain S-box-containing protein